MQSWSGLGIPVVWVSVSVREKIAPVSTSRRYAADIAEANFWQKSDFSQNFVGIACGELNSERYGHKSIISSQHFRKNSLKIWGTGE